ncbi:hypothetical protein RB195_025030 [Necator americanus]|uniref:Secreted protein n=1 Tax=Necator americanus TaxID=51031 RepID=A0ABR1EQN2_NECAM
MMRVFLFNLLVAVLFIDIAEPSVDVFPLQRISRSQLALSTLLVPYPRVGKRSTNGTDHQLSAPILHAKRLFATVGKRTYMYAARVGK